MRDSSVAMAAATDTGLPANVLAWYTGPDGASLLIISFLPPIAAIGRPLPSAFANVARSGLMPKNSPAPPSSSRKPVTTSSNIKTTSFCSVIFLTSLRYLFSGGTSPMFASTGSIMTHAVSRFFSIACSRAAGSLYGTTAVRADASSSTPSDAGMLAAPEPAFART